MTLETLQKLIGAIGGLIALVTTIAQLIASSAEKKKTSNAEAIIAKSNIVEADKAVIRLILTQHRRLALMFTFAAVVICIGGFTAALVTHKQDASDNVREMLRLQDPNVFNTDRSSNIEIVRAFPGETRCLRIRISHKSLGTQPKALT